ASAGGQAMGNWGADDRVYVPLPLFHTAGGVAALGGAVQGGSTAVIAERFSTSRFWSDCVEHGVTAFQYIGELCRYLLNAPEHPDERRHRVRVAVGNGLRPDVWPAFQERFGIEQIVEFYGATEGNVALVNLDGRVGAVGRLPGAMRSALGVHLVRFDVESEEVVRDPQGRCIEAEPGEAGELVAKISRTARFDGYSDEAATEKKVLRDVFADGDAFFRTGDLLRLADDGYYEFVDRIGDTFRWKGENVSTAEVSEVLGMHPAVGEANAYGVEAPGGDGRCGMAAIVAEGELDPADLGRHVAAELPAYARPRFVRLVDSLVVTGTFKHRKVELVRDGFDPAVIDDPLWFLDPASDEYVPLDATLHQRIVEGEVRL
ncbi:MAG: AMP-binding protein, partial [Actinomycetota bacterium]